MKSNDWKDRLGVMYSTNPDFQYNTCLLYTSDAADD